MSARPQQVLRPSVWSTLKLAALSVLMTGLSYVVVLSGTHPIVGWSGIALFGGFGVLAVAWELLGLDRVELDDEGMTIRRVTGTRRCAWHEIEHVAVAELMHEQTMVLIYLKPDAAGTQGLPAAREFWGADDGLQASHYGLEDAALVALLDQWRASAAGREA